MRLQYEIRVLRKILIVKTLLLYGMGSLVPDTVTDEHILSVKGEMCIRDRYGGKLIKDFRKIFFLLNCRKRRREEK